MTTTHTPGPWAVRQNLTTDDFHIGPDNQVAVAILRSDAHAENQDANSHLIAAAPDLLKALEKLVDAVDRNAVRQEDWPELRSAYAAIRAARGEG